ncbi:DUF2188 domain-containing protein [Nesterenkonia massiliensis]|uniref:DUF2188 domain-containing protein n=1 Tax=Nesterenkonia massiliensis TaxID=1232429 RepID=UPI0003FF1F3C|nr:DUF2188 domain-containing protein [Nesterenkonia massiliensis]
MAKADYTVYRDGDDWVAKGVGNQRASARTSTQQAAYDKAWGYSNNAGGGEVTIAGVDGKFRAKHTIPPAKDPRNIRG